MACKLKSFQAHTTLLLTPVLLLYKTLMRTVKISLILQSTKSVLLRLTYGLGGKEAWRPLNFS